MYAVQPIFKLEWEWSHAFLRITTLHILEPILIARSVSGMINVAILSIHTILSLVNNFYAGKRFKFGMDIRTFNCTGILLYVATPLYPDHVLLELTDGMVLNVQHVVIIM